MQHLVRNAERLNHARPLADDLQVQGISDLIAVPALINLDFADVKTVMESGGMAHMGIPWMP